MRMSKKRLTDADKMARRYPWKEPFPRDLRLEPSKFAEGDRVYLISPDGELLQRMKADGVAYTSPQEGRVEIVEGDILPRDLVLSEAEYQLHSATKGID